ncbi:MAG: hypothetical protein ISS16_02605 [Ignavibacteria bacterium]|nr:hypothetical protein [Ignavibacteria bacterium]
MKTQINTNKIFLYIILIVVFLCCLSPQSSEAQITVTLKADTDIVKLGDDIQLTYTIKNTGDRPIYYFDRSFITAKLEDGKTIEVFPVELFVRADWRESKSEYVLLEAGDSISHTYSYRAWWSYDPETDEIARVSPGKIYLKYEVTRTKEENFYYDFEHEHIHATTKIHIGAWTGTVESNEAVVELIE